MIDTFNPDEWEVVWDGSKPLLPPRESKPDPTWEPSKRLYNRRSEQIASDEDNDGVTALEELQQNEGYGDE